MWAVPRPKQFCSPRTAQGRYRLAGRADAATTVEAPDENVVVGVRRAIAELGRRAGTGLGADDTGGSGRFGLDREKVDIYLSTSSAGGGLQVMVCGVMRQLTAKSAEQAALGAGAIVLDVLAVDDERTPLQRFRAISAARPDMVLVAGGMEGGTPRFVLETCDFLNLSEMRPRFGDGYRLPIVFAGAENVRELVAEMLSRRYDVLLAPNLRPDVSRENLEPVRQAIVEIFESHVMKQAPGYEELLTWVDGPVLPTPVAVGKILGLLSEREGKNILCMDLGGATTDVFSFVDRRFTRSVSANLGVSYSATNVMAQAGAARIASWLPFEVSENDLRDQIGAKTLHPTTIPETLEELFVEQALATEAIRLAVDQHLTVYQPETGPRELEFGRQQLRLIREDGRQAATLADLDARVIIGSGGLLASAPLRAQAAMVLLNSCRAPGVNTLFVDSVFMLPHLGILSDTQPDIAAEVLYADCLIPLGTAVQVKPAQQRRSLLGRTTGGAGRGEVTAMLAAEGGASAEIRIGPDALGVLPLARGLTGELTVCPHGGQDFGAGPGVAFTAKVSGGEVGVIVDNRPDPSANGGAAGAWPGPARAEAVRGWLKALGAWPEGFEPDPAGLACGEVAQ